MNTLEINATDEETFVDLPAGDVELTTPHPVVFWCASADPSIRFKDYRTELQRLHAGSPKLLGAIPEGWKLAVSLRADLPALHAKRPPKPTPPADPGPTAEELAERASRRVAARDAALQEQIDLIRWVTSE